MLDCGGHFKVGDPMPEGYGAREDWAKVHLDAGLKQDTCNHCCLYFFPHQLTDEVFKSPAYTSRGEKVWLESRRCKECDAKLKAKEALAK